MSSKGDAKKAAKTAVKDTEEMVEDSEEIAAALTKVLKEREDFYRGLLEAVKKHGEDVAKKDHKKLKDVYGMIEDEIEAMDLLIGILDEKDFHTTKPVGEKAHSYKLFLQGFRQDLENGRVRSLQKAWEYLTGRQAHPYTTFLEQLKAIINFDTQLKKSL